MKIPLKQEDGLPAFGTGFHFQSIFVDFDQIERVKAPPEFKQFFQTVGDGVFRELISEYKT